MITTVKLINIPSPHIFGGVIRESEIFLSKFPVLLIVVIIAVH